MVHLQPGGLTPPPPSPNFGHWLATPCRGFVLTPTLPTAIHSTVTHFSGHCTGAGCRRQPAVLEPSALRPTSPQHTLRVAQCHAYCYPPPFSQHTATRSLHIAAQVTTDMLQSHNGHAAQSLCQDAKNVFIPEQEHSAAAAAEAVRKGDMLVTQVGAALGSGCSACHAVCIAGSMATLPPFKAWPLLHKWLTPWQLCAETPSSSQGLPSACYASLSTADPCFSLLRATKP